MSDKEIIKRRTFIAKTGKAGAALGLSSLAFFERTLDAMPGMKPEINIFSKHLQWLNYAEMARTAAAMGWTGCCFTPTGVEPIVRSNGKFWMTLT